MHSKYHHLSVSEFSLLGILINDKGKYFRNELVKYFTEIRALLPKSKTVLCTSDILESAFGKYKNYVSNNPMAGITNLTLSIAAFTSSLTDDVIKTALENTSINDIQKWTEDNIGKTLLKRRRTALVKPGRKKAGRKKQKT